MEDIKQSEQHKEKAADGVEAAIPAVQKPKQPAKGLKKKLLQVAALIAMSFLGVMAIVAGLYPPQQNEQVPPQKKPVEEIRPSNTPDIASPKTHTAAMPAIEKFGTQDTYKDSRSVTVLLGVLLVGVSIALWWHYSTTNPNVYHEPSVNRINEIKEVVDNAKQLVDNAKQVVDNAKQVVNKAKQVSMAKKAANDLQVLWWFDCRFNHISFLHEIQAMYEMNRLKHYQAKSEKILAESEKISAEVVPIVKRAREKLKNAMVKAERAFKYNKGVRVIVVRVIVLRGLLREYQNNIEKSIDYNIIYTTIAQYVDIYVDIVVEKFTYKNIEAFIDNSQRYYKGKIKLKKIGALIDNGALTKWINAAKSGNKEELKKLYKQHGDNIMVCSDDESDHPQTALMWSAYSGHLACVKYLHEQGADIHAKNKYGRTALMLSAQKGYLKCVKYLVKQGADINNGESTALMESAENGHVDCVKYLHEAGADINAKDNYGDTALMESAYEGHLKCVKYLVEQGADVNAKNKNGRTALIKSAYKDHLECLQYLVKQGADINAKDKGECTALERSTLNGSKRCKNYLLNQASSKRN